MIISIIDREKIFPEILGKNVAALFAEIPFISANRDVLCL